MAAKFVGIDTAHADSRLGWEPKMVADPNGSPETSRVIRNRSRRQGRLSMAWIDNDETVQTKSDAFSIPILRARVENALLFV